MAAYVDQLVLFDKTNARYILPDEADTLELNLNGLTLNSNTTIGGDLTVTGTTTTVHSETVLIKDNFLDLNFSYSTNTAQQGGITINYQPLLASPPASASFTSGVAGTSNPVIAVASGGGSSFAVGDIIQVSDATNDTNDGLYLISGVSGDNLTVYGVGTAGVPAIHSWAKDQLTTATDTAATVTKVKLSVLKVTTSGVWQVGSGQTIASGAEGELTYAAIQTGTDTSETLQTAYVAGNTITTSSGEGNVVIAGDQKLLVSASSGLQVSGGALDVDTSIDFDGSTLDAQASGAISLDAGAASNFTTSAGALTLSGAGGVTVTSTGGTLTLNGTGQTVDLNAAAFDLDATSLDIDSTGTVDIDGTVSTFKGSTAVVVGSGSSVLQISSGALTDSSMSSYSWAPSGAFDVTAGNSSTINVTGTLSLVGSTGHSVVSTGGTYLLNAAGRTIDMDCTTFDLDASGAVQIQGGSDSTIQMINADLDIGTVTSGDININSAADLDLDGATVNIDSAGALSLDAAGASNLTTSSGALTLSGAGGLNLAGNGSEIDITTADAMVDINAGSFDLDTTGNIDMDGVVSTLNGSTALVMKNGSANVQIASAALTDSSMASYAFNPSGAFDVTAGASSTVNVTGTLSLVGSTGHSVVSTGGTYLLNATGQTINQDCATFDLDSTGAVNIDGAAASRINVAAANLTLKTTTSGAINLESAGQVLLQPTEYTRNRGFFAVNGNNPITDSSGAIGIRMQAGESISTGDVLYIGDGGFFKADANVAAKAFPIAVATENMSTGSTFYSAASVAGSFVSPTFDSAPNQSDLGKRVYLSETAGQVTLTPPTSTSGAFVYQVGHLIYKSGNTSGNLICWAPQFIMEVP